MAENISNTGASGSSAATSQAHAPQTSQTIQSEVIKTRKKRSAVWDFFTIIVDAKGNREVVCVCGKKFGYSGSGTTSSMKTHVNEKCPNNPLRFGRGQQKLALQSSPGGGKGDGFPVPWKFDQEECRMALCRMVIVDEHPFSFVEKEGFRNFMKVAQPSFRIPSRTTVTRDCYALFNVEKKKLMKFFNDQEVSLTTDTWTSIQKINYMCITAHWINSDWIMHKRVINFCPITSHKGDDMARSITDCLREWGLKKIFTVTVDNANSNDTTLKKLSDKLKSWGTDYMNGGHLHVRCMAHIINLIVKEGIKESVISVDRIRYAVRYIRQSPARWKKFQECCEGENLSKKSLLLDVPTRWNSTYLMLSRAIEYERATKEYSDRDKDLALYLDFDAISDKKPVGMFTTTDWDNVKRISKFLEVFYSLTLKVSGSLYVTSNSHFLEIGQVAVYLKRLMSNEDELLGEMAKSMKGKFDKYWGEPEKMNKMIFIACVLDPRYKFASVSFALGKMFEEKGPIVEKAVRTYMTSLFDEYVKSDSKGTGNNVATSLPSSSSDTMETTSLGLGEFLEEIRRHKATSGGADSKSELEKYLAEELENERPGFDILNWWKVNSPRFPVLAKMARNVLAIPISSVASEIAFSTGGRILDPFRSSLTPKLVETLVCLQDWLRCESLPVNVEEDLEFLEKLEEDVANLGFEASTDAE